MQGNVFDESRIKTLLLLLIGFFLVFDACAIIIQIASGEAPNQHGTIVDMFTGSVLWMASIVALFIAVTRYPNTRKFMLWLAVSAGAGALAIDEMFEIHEQTLYWFGEDDYIKFVIMLAAVAGLIMLHQTEKPSIRVVRLFCIGFLFHIAYLTVDFGDGDFFQLPFSADALYWAEEIFEMCAIQTYFAGLTLFFVLQALDSSAAEEAPVARKESAGLKTKPAA